MYKTLRIKIRYTYVIPTVTAMLCSER